MTGPAAFRKVVTAALDYAQIGRFLFNVGLNQCSMLQRNFKRLCYLRTVIRKIYGRKRECTCLLTHLLQIQDEAAIAIGAATFGA